MSKHNSNTHQKFSIDVRIYYEDTDLGGVVYHSNYLNYMERARTELFRKFGMEQDQLIRDFQTIFVVRSAQVEYLIPAKFNQILRITVTIKKYGRAYALFFQEIYRVHSDESLELLVEGTIKIVSVDAVSFKPKRIPNQIMEKLNGRY